LLAAVHVITEEQVIGLRRESTVFEEAKEVMILSMDIATDLQWCLKLQESRLRNVNFATCRT
jgi:hypothetical protein